MVGQGPVDLLEPHHFIPPLLLFPSLYLLSLLVEAVAGLLVLTQGLAPQENVAKDAADTSATLSTTITAVVAIFVTTTASISSAGLDGGGGEPVRVIQGGLLLLWLVLRDCARA